MRGLSDSHLNTVNTVPDLDEAILEACSHGDLSARERIISAYYPLVVKICQEYKGRGVPMEDLFQEGCYGLLLAMDKYDPSLHKSFGKHAAAYIRKCIQNATISQSGFRPIVYKEDFFYELQRYSRALDDLTLRLSREPSSKELAMALKTTENRVRRLAHSLYTFFSLEALENVPVREFSDLATLSHNTLEERVTQGVLDLSCLGVELSKREEEILCRHFGFTDSGAPESLLHISKEMGLPFESVRSAFNRTMNKLRKAVEEHGYTVSTISI